ncbi:sigma-70 family RNA polymerase sigma factor [Auraticoccus monumenti]|uniref:RNA polymerase sigma-70 factor, ECF subfamily n=1 Tax=Auraticoccus monumenti TaxID=675864 RepID=A0A1G6THW0_9ACTN|nr:sigma-70 family RNA polymerase sigma factor [Auraticoccus monumenti]SDD28678.1 RNA polymerase sigma-70 factor, ECF subfamily [Auraticoccus monumenti]
MTDPAVTGSGLEDAFDARRQRLRSIAHRVLGSHWDADDAVQETWVRLSRVDADTIDNLNAWLTTVVSRVSIDLLRSRGARREDLDDDVPDTGAEDDDPETVTLRDEEVEAAMVVVLDQLTPLERLAFVLHDVFGLSFADVAPIVERSPAAARQLASRARRRVAGVDVPAERTRRADAVAAFLKASRQGDFGDLLQLLDPEVELRADPVVVAGAQASAEAGAPLLQPRVRGADAVARVFAGRAEETRVAIIDGLPGAVFAPDGVLRAAFVIHLGEHGIAGLEVIGDPSRLAQLRVVPARP